MGMQGEFFFKDNELHRQFKQMNEALESMKLADAKGEWMEQCRKHLKEHLQALRDKVADRVGSQYPGTRNLAGGVLRTTYAKRLGGNVKIQQSHRAKSAPSRPYVQGTERNRTVSARTRQVYGYTGVDAQFILRWLNKGSTNSRETKRPAKTGRGSRATYGARDAMKTSKLRGFMQSFESSLDQLAKQWGKQITDGAAELMDAAK